MKQMVLQQIDRQAIVCLVCLLTFSVTASAQIIVTDTVYATYYADRFHGRKTSNGDIYNKDSFTCAHRSLPFGTLVKVTNIRNGKTAIVKVNDRGPFGKRAKIDLSKAAAKEIDMLQLGIIKVRIEALKDTTKQLINIIKDTISNNEEELRDSVRTGWMDSKER